MNDTAGAIGLGILMGLVKQGKERQQLNDYNKGLAAIMDYGKANDPNSKAAQDAYMAQTYGNNPAYQSMEMRINDVNKIAQDKSTWGAQNDIMSKEAQDAATLRSKLQGIDQSYLSPDLSASGLASLLANADEATKNALTPLLNDKTQYETAQTARDAAAKQADVDRQAATQAGVPANLIGANVDLSNMPQNPNAYMDGIGLTPAQMQQYLADKSDPSSAVARTYDPMQYQIGMQQALLNSGVKLDTLQKLSPLLQGMAQNATENSTKQKYSQFIPSLLNGDQAQQKYALVNMYLTDPKRMPYEVMKELISSNVKPVDSGNQILMYRTDAYNNFLDSDQNGNPVPYITIDKQPSPDTALRVGEQRFEYTNPSANTLAQLKERQYEHDNPSGNAKLQSQTQLITHNTPSGSIMYQANTPGKNAQVNQIKAMEQYLNLRYKLNPDEMVNDPVYKVYVSAIQGLSGAGGSNTDSQSTGSDSVADWINRVKQAGASKEQVLQALHDKGYGNAYDSYVW